MEEMICFRKEQQEMEIVNTRLKSLEGKIERKKRSKKRKRLRDRK